MRHAFRTLRFFLKHYKVVIESMSVERVALSTFTYKNHNRFRNDKGFRDIKLTSKCLARFYECELSKVTTDLLDALPIVASIDDATLYLPTSAMAEYALERLEGAFRVLEKLTVYCKLSGEMQFRRLNLGHLWNVALASLAAISRIWKISKTLLALINAAHSSISMLANILPCSSTERRLQTKSILESCEDEELKLDVSKVDIPGLPQRPKIPGVGAEDTKRNVVIDSGHPFNGIGEVISREEAFAPQVEKLDTNATETSTSSVLPCSKKRIKMLIAEVDSWNAASDACKFVEAETKVRKTARKEAATKKLDQAQWKELRGHIQTMAERGKKLNRLKELVLAWVLYPKLKGKKPPQWDRVLQELR